MKRRLIILGILVLAVMISSFLTPLRASATFQEKINGAMVFAEGEANTHAGTPGFSLAWVQRAFNADQAPAGAASAWAYYLTLGRPHDGTKPEDVPRGALVFFSGSGGYGHVGIALGNGQMVSNLNVPGIRTGVYRGPLSEGGTLAGWAWPPADWPGRPELTESSNDQVAASPTQQSPAKPALAKPVPARATPARATPARQAPAPPRPPRTPTTPSPTTTSTTLDVTASSVSPSDTQQLMATVVPLAAAGSVQFKNNGTNIGNPVNVSSGTALTTTMLPVGTHSLTAVFTPIDVSAFGSSTSNTVTYVVKGATATTTVLKVTPPSPAPSGTKETLTATVSPADAAGSVQFKYGSSIIGSAGVSGGIASTTTKLPVATHELTAVFTPSDSTAFSASSAVAVPYEVIAEPTVNPTAANANGAAKSRATAPPPPPPPPPPAEPPSQDPAEQDPVDQDPVDQDPGRAAPSAEQPPAEQPPAEELPQQPLARPSRSGRY